MSLWKKIWSMLWPQTLNSDMENNGWKFSVEIDGDDLVVRDTDATFFGGDDDPEDNGETASGIMTKGNPLCMGCALPVVGSHPSTKGSPLAFFPRIPWKTPVEVWTEAGRRVVVPLIDNGPAKSAGNGTRGIDLTVAAFRALDGSLSAGKMRVSFRVKGAAKYANA